LIAYDRLTQAEPSKELKEAVSALLYNNKVFIAPPWKEIYHTDSERKQTYEEVIQAYDNLMKVYTEYGRELVKIPKMSVEKRADFVISHVTDWLNV
jgi:predicted ATPase